MARATVCTLDGQEIGINEALQLREGHRRHGPRLDFRCIECGESVRANKDGGDAQAHFEHFSRNPVCRLSDPGR